MDKEKNTTNDKPTTLKQSTKWTPPNSQDQNFDSYRNLTQREILKELDISPSYRRFNLPKSERQAIKTLTALTKEVRKMQYLTVYLSDAKGSAQKIDTLKWRSRKLRTS